MEKVTRLINDIRPFPIQGGWWRRKDRKRSQRIQNCVIPWWLAEEAYEYYSELFGKDQSLERIAERGGFGRDELLWLLSRTSFDEWTRKR